MIFLAFQFETLLVVILPNRKQNLNRAVGNAFPPGLHGILTRKKPADWVGLIGIEFEKPPVTFSELVLSVFH